MIVYYLISLTIPFIAVALMLPAVRYWARKAGFLDIPAGVKTHRTPTPLGGGIAVYLGSVLLITILLTVFGFDIPRSAVGMISGATLAFLIGLYDDFLQMGPLTKIAGELIAAIIFLAFVEKYPPIISFSAFLLLSSIWIIGLQNAINFIDSLDGMCSGISLTIALGFGILFVLKGMPVFAMISFALAGGALGFLRYNLPPASIFLGDGGSLLFGFFLSCLGVVHLDTSSTMAGALAPILIMAFPIFNMTLVTMARLNKGRKVYVDSRDHAWDMLRVLGLSRETTVSFIILINLLLVSAGILIFFIEGSPIQTLIVVGLALLLAFVGTQLYRNFLFLRFNIANILADLAAIMISFAIYYLIKYKSGLLVHSAAIPPSELAVPLAWVSIYWILLYSIMGLYDISFERGYATQLWILLKSVIIGTVFFLAVNFSPGSGFQVSIGSLLVFIGILLLISGAVRAIVYEVIISRLRSPNHKLNAVIVRGSSGSTGYFDNYLYNVVGSVGYRSGNGPEWLGNLDDLQDILERTGTARVILDIGNTDYTDLRGIFGSAYYMETLFLAPSSAQDNLKGLKRHTTIHRELDIISTRHRRLFTLILRRLTDALCSLGLMVVLWPYWLAKSLILYSGKAGISTEISVANRFEQPMKMKHYIGDSNAIKVTNPWVLLAVLKGQLSLTGVTLDTFSDYRKFSVTIPGYWRKFLLKPGIFGPGYYGKTDRQRFDLDLEYMEKTSLLRDIPLMIKQIFSKPVFDGRLSANARY